MLSTPQFLQQEQAFDSRLYFFLKGYTSKECLSSDMASAVAGMEGDFDFVEMKSKIQGLEMCLLHQQALLANSYAWMWLDKDCMDHCRYVMDLVLNVQVRSTSTWLERLSMDIYDAVLARSRDNAYWVSLLPHTYLPALPAKVESYRFHCRGVFHTPTAITNRVCQILNEVFACGLDIPPTLLVLAPTSFNSSYPPLVLKMSCLLMVSGLLPYTSNNSSCRPRSNIPLFSLLIFVTSTPFC